MIPPFVIAMLGVLVSWTVLIAIFVGIGLGIQRAFRLREITTRRVLVAFWMGLVFVVGFLQLWHLFLPIALPALACVAVLGAAGLAWNGPTTAAYLRRGWARRKAAVIPIAILAVWLANRAVQPCTTYDTGLYHTSAVRWATEYPIVPGLGNLHSRLAFNNANHLVAAMLEVGPWYGRSYHLPNGLYALMVALQCVAGAYALFAPDPRRRQAGLFDLLLLTPVILIAVHSWTSSHATDLPAAMIGFVAASGVFRFCLLRDRPMREQAYDVVFLAAVLTVGVCVKLSMLMFVALGVPLVLGVWAARALRRRASVTPPLLAVAGAVGLLIIPWMLRGVILSGYPLFPSTIGRVDVPWRMPDYLVRSTRAGIATFARRAQDTQGWGWLRPWAGELDRETLLPAALILLAAAALAASGIIRRARPAPPRQPWLALLPAAGGIVFWFFTAPAQRFGMFLFWILAAGLVAIFFACFAAGASRRRLTVVLVICLVFSACHIKKGFHARFAPLPQVPLEIYRTESGLKLYVPAEGDQCWDAPLPCTPHPQKNLRLRRPGRLESGFVIEGDQPPG